jgi:hypothetical protein
MNHFELDLTAEWTVKRLKALLYKTAEVSGASVFVVTEHNDGELLRVWALSEGPHRFASNGLEGSRVVTVCLCVDELLTHLIRETEAS